MAPRMKDKELVGLRCPTPVAQASSVSEDDIAIVGMGS